MLLQPLLVEFMGLRQLQEMLPDHGPGFLYLALRELRGNADEVVSFLVEKMKPAALRSVPLKATLQGNQLRCPLRVPDTF